MSVRIAPVPARRARWLQCRHEPGLGPVSLLRLAVERTLGQTGSGRGRRRTSGHRVGGIGLL